MAWCIDQYADHAGGTLLDATPHPELDVLTTWHEGNATSGVTETVLVTVASLNASAWRPRPLLLSLEPAPPPGKGVAVVTLTASGFDERSTFTRSVSRVTVGKGGALSLTVPPFSVVRASVAIR